ncbi:polyprotein [Plakobranchus ocellatus]|uniref:Polyprotein n=1 Tax=Plakobranchus ocellatus TaxID=259542 RepID=A0AAV4B3C3_9GAST|nr:polyprotein [Plakobranchus ocellatus]
MAPVVHAYSQTSMATLNLRYLLLHSRSNEAKINKYTRKWLGFPPGLSDEAMYCQKAKLKLPMKSILEEYKCGKARLLTMLEESDDPVVKTVQPPLKTGRKWKVTEAVDEAKEYLKMKEVIGQTQTDRRGLGSTTAKWWSKTQGKEKRDMIIDEIRNKEDSIRVQKAVQQPQQGQWTQWDTALQRSLTWNDIWHMAPLRISFLIRSVYDLLPSKANLVRWGKKDVSPCPLCQGRQTTEHVMSLCKVALSQGRYTWRHNRVLQKLASVISTAKGEIHPSSTSPTVFTTEVYTICPQGELKNSAQCVDGGQDFEPVIIKESHQTGGRVCKKLIRQCSKEKEGRRGRQTDRQIGRQKDGKLNIDRKTTLQSQDNRQKKKKEEEEKWEEKKVERKERGM